MNRWQKGRKQKIIFSFVALMLAWLIRYVQAAPIMEFFYLISAPFQSQKQLSIEDHLTNARILELEQNLVELEQQNAQFRALIDSSSTENKNPSELKSGDVIAPIIARDVDNWLDQVILGKGSKDGIKPGHIVLGIGGVVGRVISVSNHTSRILLVSASNSRIGVNVSRSRNMGYLKGKNSQVATMHFFSKVIDVKVGDAISTSTISNLYPHGLTVGRVIELDYDQGPAPQAEIQLTAPIDLLEWVVIRPFQPKLS